MREKKNSNYSITIRVIFFGGGAQARSESKILGAHIFQKCPLYLVLSGFKTQLYLVLSGSQNLLIMAKKPLVVTLLFAKCFENGF